MKRRTFYCSCAVVFSLLPSFQLEKMFDNQNFVIVLVVHKCLENVSSWETYYDNTKLVVLWLWEIVNIFSNPAKLINIFIRLQ